MIIEQAYELLSFGKERWKGRGELNLVDLSVYYQATCNFDKRKVIKQTFPSKTAQGRQTYPADQLLIPSHISCSIQSSINVRKSENDADFGYFSASCSLKICSY